MISQTGLRRKEAVAPIRGRQKGERKSYHIANLLDVSREVFISKYWDGQRLSRRQ